MYRNTSTVVRLYLFFQLFLPNHKQTAENQQTHRIKDNTVALTILKAKLIIVIVIIIISGSSNSNTIGSNEIYNKKVKVENERMRER